MPVLVFLMKGIKKGQCILWFQ